MKALFLALLTPLAMATERNPQPGPSTSSATAQAAANAYGGTSGGGWTVALPGHGSPSYAGNYSICVRGSGIGWNFFWSWAPDMECVKMIADLERLNRTPIPQKPVALLTEWPAPTASDAKQIKDLGPSIEQKVATCPPPPAKAKTVAAAKASGACKG